MRLKGGDPGIFGRAGEEAALLRAHGIEVHCVPGITAALGCSASAGFPLTHRGEARVLHVATGHCRAGDELDLDWTRLADPNGTIALYMGRGSLRSLAGNLMAHGLPADTPAVAIENGTLANERRLFAPLADLPEAAHDLTEGPVLVIVGSVVRRAPDWPLPAHADPLGQGLRRPRRVGPPFGRMSAVEVFAASEAAPPRDRLASYLGAIGRGPGRSRPLSLDEARDAFRIVLSGDADPMQVGALLLLLRYRGESAPELAGFVEAARAHVGAPSLGSGIADLDWPSYAAGRSRVHRGFFFPLSLVARGRFKVVVHGQQRLPARHGHRACCP